MQSKWFSHEKSTAELILKDVRYKLNMKLFYNIQIFAAINLWLRQVDWKDMGMITFWSIRTTINSMHNVWLTHTLSCFHSVCAFNDSPRKSSCSFRAHLTCSYVNNVLCICFLAVFLFHPVFLSIVLLILAAVRWMAWRKCKRKHWHKNQVYTSTG